MAFLQTSEPLNLFTFSSLGIDRGDPIFESTGEFTVRYEDGRTGTYLGSYTLVGGEVVGGTATTYVETFEGTNLFAIGQFSVPLAAFEQAILGGTLRNLFETRIFNGDDSFLGSDAADYLLSWNGNDALEGAGGNDTLDGGNGTDTALYQDERNDYALTLNADGSVTVRDLDGDEGTDRLISIEDIVFGEGPGSETYDLDLFTGIAALDAGAIRLFVEMYIAYFNRAPDAEGLFYWGTRLSEGMSIEQIARSFFVQDETVALYPDPSNVAKLVNDVYLNVLERPADNLGRQYWIDELTSGRVERGEFILSIIDGAKKFADPNATPELIAQAKADVQTIADKADIGIYYAVIKGLGDPFGDAREAMAAYDVADREACLSFAKQQIDRFETDNAQSFSFNLAGVVDDPFAIA